MQDDASPYTGQLHTGSDLIANHVVDEGKGGHQGFSEPACPINGNANTITQDEVSLDVRSCAPLRLDATAFAVAHSVAGDGDGVAAYVEAIFTNTVNRVVQNRYSCTIVYVNSVFGNIVHGIVN